MEGIIKQGDVARLFSHRCTCTHRKSYLCVVQCRGIVGSVACYSHYSTFLLQELHQSLLVHRAGTAHHFQVEHTVESFFIAQSGKLHARNTVAFGIFGFPQTYLTGNLGSCSRCVTRHNLHADACRLAFLYGIRHIGTNRVTDGKDAQEGQSALVYQFGTIGRCICGHYLIGKPQGTHCLVLVSKQLLIIGIYLFLAYVAFSHHDFRRTFHVKYPLLLDRRIYQRSHILAFGGERKLVHHFSTCPQRFIILTLAVEPKQQCHFSWISYTRRLFTCRFLFKESGRVCRNAFCYQVGLAFIQFCVIYLHQILCQCTGLIRTNYGNGTHCFAGMHLPHQVIGFQHPAHIQGKTKRNTHRQAFGNSHNNQGNRHHEVFQYNAGDVKPLMPIAYCIHLQVSIQIFRGKYNKGKCRNRKSDFPNQVGKFGQLNIQRSLFLALLRSLARYFTDFSSIAHTFYPHHAMPVGNGCTAHHAVRGVGSFFVKVSFHCSLVYHQFSCQTRFIHLKRYGFQQDAIGRNLLTRIKDDYISHHYVLTGNLVHFPVTDDGDGRFLTHCIQQVKLLVRIVFEIESDACSQKDSKENANGFGIFILNNRND